MIYILYSLHVNYSHIKSVFHDVRKLYFHSCTEMKRTLLDFGVTKSNKKANQNTDLQTKDTELKDDSHGESLPAASTTQSCGITHTDFAYIKAKRPSSDLERYAALCDHWKPRRDFIFPQRKMAGK